MKTKSTPAAYGGLLFLGVLILLLTLFYLPSFKNPPRSDYWSAYYVFQQVNASPDPPNWTSILTFDLWRHGAHRPLSHLIPYLEHQIFGPNFIWNHILNFLAYFLSIILLYRLAVQLALDRFLTAVFLTITAFLFSHSDVLLWTFQLFSWLGFCASLLGMILYIRFIRDRRAGLLIAIGLLFLFSMLCLETYLLWPLVVLLLPSALRPPEEKHSLSMPRSTSLMLAIIYLLYGAGFVLHRLSAHTTGPIRIPSLENIVDGFFLVFFNLLYNGIAVNIYPGLATPLFFDDNVNLGGLLLAWGDRLDGIALPTGAVGFVLITSLMLILVLKHKRRTASLLACFLFLYLTNFFTITVGRLVTNKALYPLSQFRYQYIPNALLALSAVAVLDQLVRPGKRGKAIICLLLLPVLVFNICFSYRLVIDLDERLAPLRVLLAEIARGLETGLITEEDRLFIEPAIADRLPPPSWNANMAPFMEGTFQWFFPASELGKFTLSREEAGWIIREDDCRITRLNR